MSHHQGWGDEKKDDDENEKYWSDQWDLGKKFVYIKATEGYGWNDPHFSENYTNSRNNGFIRGAYHFARPDLGNSGEREAKWFVNNGGGWSNDGKTLPGVLDIEDAPNKPDDECFELSPDEVVEWIEDFVAEYTAQVGRPPVIYTNGEWWDRCTGDTDDFNDVAPLWFARWRADPGATPPAVRDLPGGWAHYTFWQYWGHQLDQDHFNGTMRDLQHFATHTSAYSPGMASNIEFKDVGARHSFAEEIRWLSNSAITTGYDDGAFRPKNQITREAMAAFIYRLQGEPAHEAPSNSPFPDVPTTDSFYHEITWLDEQDITTGYDDHTFRPENQITREATAAFLSRYSG